MRGVQRSETTAEELDSCGRSGDIQQAKLECATHSECTHVLGLLRQHSSGAPVATGAHSAASSSTVASLAGAGSETVCVTPTIVCMLIVCIPACRPSSAAHPLLPSSARAAACIAHGLAATQATLWFALAGRCATIDWPYVYPPRACTAGPGYYESSVVYLPLLRSHSAVAYT